jgi:hypothetical protein
MNERLEPRIRVLLGSSIAIGPGKAALLEAIEETGVHCRRRSAHGYELSLRLAAH